MTGRNEPRRLWPQAGNVFVFFYRHRLLVANSTHAMLRESQEHLRSGASLLFLSVVAPQLTRIDCFLSRYFHRAVTTSFFVLTVLDVLDCDALRV